MSQTPTNEVITESPELETTLGELKAALSRQLKCLSDDEYDEFIDLGEKAAGLLHRICSATAHISEPASAHIKAIHALHHKLGLSLSGKSNEMAERMTKIKTGKTVLKAYKNSA
ncbi:MAG: hypothetical protein K8S55_10435 [Phycisphaerae bacterium]|nr:hypothetical protein [Phycisphaerae bacterium]